MKLLDLFCGAGGAARGYQNAGIHHFHRFPAEKDAVVNPRPSLIQCLVLHDIADDGVWFDMISGRWHSTHVRNDVTVQVDILHRGAYVHISNDVIPKITVTPIGKQVLDRRPLGELLERLNRV